MELRNPFGLRNNKIILIEDISKSEKGLQCNCVCPSCNEPFEARMGEIRRHHFAHSGKGCDEINAYMTGLYMLLNEFILDGNVLHLPPLIIGFRLSDHSYIIEENIEKNTWFCSSLINEKNEIQLFEKTDVLFQSSHIETSNNKPQAIIAEAKGRKLAIRITPPNTVCKIGEVKKYKDYPTIKVDFSTSGDTIQQSKKSDFYCYLLENNDIYKWVYNPLIKKAYPEIIKRAKSHYNAAQERMKKEAEERKAIKMQKLKQQAFSQHYAFDNDKIQVQSVDINGEVYSVGTRIKHINGIGIIVKITRLINDTHEICVQFNDGRTGRYGIEILVKNHMISKI